ncbi:MAG TPA: DUF4260 family protein [Microbacterium sp.]|nr:DUF4260 family protein [Microbacterium sp.]
MVLRLVHGFAALVLIGFLIFESAKYGWTMGAVVIAFSLLPDIALIGAFDRSRPGMLLRSRVRFYNALHRPWAGLVLFVVGAVVVLPALGGVDDAGKLVAVAGLAWLAHIAVDRALGYGLRDADGAIRATGRTRASVPCRA